MGKSECNASESTHESSGVQALKSSMIFTYSLILVVSVMVVMVVMGLEFLFVFNHDFRQQVRQEFHVHC